MSVLLITAADALPERARVWGRENLVQPVREREPLTWLTLAHLLGWRPEIVRGDAASALAGAADLSLVIVARDPDSLTEEECGAIAAALERSPALVIARAASPQSPLARLAGTSRAGGTRSDGAPRWTGPGAERGWSGVPELALDVTDPAPRSRRRRPRRRLARANGASGWAWLGERPLALALPLGRGTIVTLSAHPSELSESAPAGSGLLAHLLRWGVPAPVAWLDLEGTVVLRLDDPGSAAGAHLDPWAHPLPSESDWTLLADELERRRGRISIGYVSGWLDDGDPARGELTVDGKRVQRVAGAVHASGLVVYRSRAGFTHDHPAELRSLTALRGRGVAELEVHGHTHVRPDPGEGYSHERWASAEDRHENSAWYRELEGFRRSGEAPGPVARGTRAIESSTEARPAALACPGLACSPDAVECALDAGLELVSAETHSLRLGDRMAWTEHLRSVYVDGGPGPWLEAGVPAVALLHDRDVAGDPGWLAERMDEWLANGCRRFWDLRQLAAALALHVTPAGAAEDGGVPPAAPVPLALRRPGEEVESRQYPAATSGPASGSSVA